MTASARSREGADLEAKGRPARALRILYVWDDDYPWDVRTEKVCAALAAAGHEVHISARNRRWSPVEERLPEGTVHRLRPWRRLGHRLDAVLAFPVFFSPRWLAHLRRCASAVRPDVIIARDLPLCPTAIWTARRCGAAIVLDMAENYPAMTRTLWESGRQRPMDVLVRNPALVRAVEGYCLARVDRVLVVVEESARRLIDRGIPASRIDVVSNTPPLERAQPTPVVRGLKPPELVYLGLLEVPRGISEILDAAALLCARGLRPKLRIIGGGRDSDEFRARAQALGLTEDDVVFHGHMPHEAALALVARADIGIVPLRAAEAYDTTVPNKLFDYMAAGLAVVTSDTAPSARIVRETGAGEVFRAGDAADLAAALERLWEPATRRERGLAGRRAILTRYNWQRDATTLRQAVERAFSAVRAMVFPLATLMGLSCSRGNGEPSRQRMDMAPPASAATQAGASGAASLFSEYRKTSPHWPHIRVHISDYRIQYQPDASRRAAEYRWAAEHFDRIVLDNGDSRSVPEYRRLNPGAKLYRYALNWSVIRPGEEKTEDNSTSYYGHMEGWYRAHPQYRLEDAFLHDGDRCPRGASTQACRVSVHIWTQDRWCVNPGDAGLRAYQRDRLREVAADVDGLFLDEHGSEDIAERLRSLRLREYPAWERYEADMVQLLSEERAGLGGEKILLLNTSAYTTPWDLRMIAVAGGSHGELLNDAFRPGIERTWRFVEAVLAEGGIMNLSPAAELPEGYSAGNSATARARKALWELASYYLVVPETPALLALNLAPKWDEPYETRWVRALEANLGRPLGARTRLPQGNTRGLSIWQREFERALVLLREPDPAAVQKSYGDAHEVDLPGNDSFLLLNADGTLGVPTRRIALRGSEAAILIRARAIGR